MGLKPGESDCAVCRLRPVGSGGSGACPVRGTLKRRQLELSPRGDCVRFREGDYLPKRERQRLELHPQSEGLF